MNTLIDTCILPQALRRKDALYTSIITQRLQTHIQQHQVIMLGVVRQERLSGIQHENQFERIRTKLTSFADFPTTAADFEIFTADKDFYHFKKHLNFKLDLI